jgi:photosystem II stability/assembly factor-like uncharacterized protein
MVHRPTYTHARRRVAFAGASVLAFVACVVAASGIAGGASSNLLVNVDIPSSTTLVTADCAPLVPGITDFGVVTPGSRAMTGDDCEIDFGSTNDSAQLLVAQADDLGSAMGQSTPNITRHTGSSTRLSLVRATSTHVWVLQTTGSLRRSANGGATFPLIQSSMGGNHRALSFPTNQVGWMTGDGSGDVWRTVDAHIAGTPTWARTPNDPPFAPNGVAGVSASAAWVVGDNGEIASTGDSGSTWTPSGWSDAPGGPPATSDDLEGIDALDADSFAIWGADGRVLVKRDGAAWSDVSIPAGSFIIHDVDMVTNDHLVVATQYGELWQTTTANLATPTWTKVQLGTILDVEDVEMRTPLVGVAVGNEGLLARTYDGGLTWTKEHVDASHPMAGVAWIDANTLVAAGGSRAIERSTDAGTGWTNVNFEYQTWQDVAMGSGSMGWRVGSDGSVDRTTNGGSAWAAQASTTTADLFGVDAWSAQRAVAVGRDGTIVTTSNGGTNWTVRTSGTSEELQQVDAFETGRAWAVGRNGTILRSDDYGATWSVVRTQPGIELRDVGAVSHQVAVAVGRNGAMYRTTDGGATWSTPAHPVGTNPFRSLAVDVPSGYVYAQAYGNVIRSVDGGATWTIRSGTSTYLSMDVVNRDTIYIAGVGTMRRSDDGGATWTALSGAPTSGHWVLGIDAIDTSRAVLVGDGGLTSTIGPINEVDDYELGVTDWYDDGSEAFGMCLRATTATPTWTPNATCDQTADGAHWQPVPASPDPPSEVATTGPTDGIRTAQFRFGLRLAPNQPPGQLSAAIAFTVLAPDP